MLLTMIVTAPGSVGSAHAEEMLGIYLREKGSLAMLSLRYVPQLMFENGEVYTDINVPPEDLDIAASKQTEPERWGRWRRDGDDVYFDLSEGEKKVKLYKNAVVPAPDSLQLEGVWSYQFASVSVDQSASVVVERDIGFARNGVFATGKFSSASASGTGGSATGYSEEQLTPKGTYRISGYSVEFTHHDGTVERKLFFFYPGNEGEPDYETINVGASHYQREADSFSAELQADSSSEGSKQAARSGSASDGIPITPGRWRFESYTPAGDLDQTDDYCLTEAVFDPLTLVNQEDWESCDMGPPIVDGQHGVYNLACSGTHQGEAVQIGFKFDLTIENGEGEGLFALAHLRDEGVVMGETYGLKMRRSGDC
ncbi:MAG: hypothetical protein ACR2QJ_09680 [Geminicoccaceae bacterium]